VPANAVVEVAVRNADCKYALITIDLITACV